MASNLALIAARGVDRLSISTLDPHPLVHQMVTASGAVDEATYVLHSAALHTLRNRAGFVPERDLRPLEQVIDIDETHEQVTYSADILRILSVIYHSLEYGQAYAEWLHWVTLEDLTFPYEALPMMLTLATIYPHTQGMTKRVIGSRGRWLVRYSGHRGWYWVNHTKPAKRPRLTKYEKLEGRVLQKLAEVRYQRIPLEASFELQNMHFPWSVRLSDKVADAVEHSLSSGNPYGVDDLLRLADKFKWSIHPSQNHRILDAFYAYSERASQQHLYATSELERLLAFRGDLTAAFTSEL